MHNVLISLSGYEKRLLPIPFFIVLFVFIVLPANRSNAAEFPSTSVFYCPADEIPFIGELLPPVMSILEEKKVKEELGLTDIELDRLREQVNNFSAKMKAAFAEQNGGDKSSTKNAKSNIEFAKTIGLMIEDSRKRTSDILKPHQLARMKELVLQRVGIISIPKKEIQQVLHLEKKQERSIDEIRSKFFSKINKSKPQYVVKNAEGKCKLVNPDSRKLAKFLVESDRAAYLLLTPDQKETINKLKGKPFSF